MKKIGNLIALFILMFVVCGTLNVSAMSEDDLLKKITATYDIKGQKYSLSEGDKVLAKRYLDTYNVSSSDCDYISGKIDEVLGAMRNSSATDFSDFSKFPASLKNTLKQYVVDVAEHTSIKATTKKGAVVIYNSDGTVFAEISKLVKPTGNTMNVISIVALGVSAIGAMVLFRNVKANA